MNAATSFGTLSEFLLQAGTEYFIIDVSRTRLLLDNQQFFDYETNKLPFAHPRQGHAWLCIVFWNKQLSEEHYMWFLKLPLDEQSLLVQAARDQFLHTVATALGQQLQGMQEGKTELPENPFIFVPSQQLLADCNTLIRSHLQLPARKLADKASQYIKAPNVQPWSELSVQDMSDLAMNISEREVCEAFVRNMTILPYPVSVCLCSSFEGIRLPNSAIDSILHYHRSSETIHNVNHDAKNANHETSIGPLLLRALASSQNKQVLEYLCEYIISNDTIDPDTFIVIAGRHWQALSPEMDICMDYLSSKGVTDSLLHIFFDKLAQSDSTFALFKGIYADLVQIPSLRVFLLAMLRAPKLSNSLNKAVSSLLSMA